MPSEFSTAGVDEAGRGAWAGPVVAAAVICGPLWVCPGLADSKTLSAASRERIYEVIYNECRVKVGIVDNVAIDSTNIRSATFLAMRTAVLGLTPKPTKVIVDGIDMIPDLGVRQTPIAKADTKIKAVMAASIVAKVTRDRLMEEFSEDYPEYGFETHKGYGTAAHRAALNRLGLTPIHRTTFKPMREMM